MACWFLYLLLFCIADTVLVSFWSTFFITHSGAGGRKIWNLNSKIWINKWTNRCIGFFMAKVCLIKRLDFNFFWSIFYAWSLVLNFGHHLTFGGFTEPRIQNAFLVAIVVSIAMWKYQSNAEIAFHIAAKTRFNQLKNLSFWIHS